LGHIPAVPDFDAGEWRFPAKITADVGRESKADIEEIKIGLRSKTQVNADRGEDRQLVRNFTLSEKLEVIEDAKKLMAQSGGEIDLKTAISYGKELAQYNLFWYEEAGDPLDYELQAELGNHYENSMATGENLFSMQDARNLIRYGGMRRDRDWLQFDCALSYGLVEYLRTLDMLREYDWSPTRCVPHGGHQMSLAIAAGLGLGGNESYPDLFQPYGGFPDGARVENSIVTLPELVGIGFEGKADLYAEMKALAN
jgi:L-alanine-DL-glutamate epimerase-like enolase superfamily enzyme